MTDPTFLRKASPSLARPRCPRGEAVWKALARSRRSGWLQLVVAAAFLASPRVTAQPEAAQERQAAESLSVPIAFTEPDIVSRHGEIAGLGVPVRRGWLFSDGRSLPLTVLDAEGNPVPFQTRVLARWPDRSVRWLRVELPVDVERGETVTYHLSPGGEQASLAAPIAIERIPGGWSVETGALRVRFRYGGGVPFDEVSLDADQDGRFSASELTIAPESTDAVLTGLDAQTFSARAGLESLELLETGPLRTTIALEGVHRSAEGRWALRYRGLVHLLKDQPQIHVSWSLANPLAPGSEKASTFKSYELVTAVPLEGSHRFVHAADTDYAGYLKEWPTFFLYQGLVSTQTGFAPLGLPTNPVGYTIGKMDLGKIRPIRSGDRAQGAMSIVDETRGVAVAVRNFWENFPKMIRLEQRGEVGVGLWPAVPGSYAHALEGGMRKTHDVLFRFVTVKEEPGEISTTTLPVLTAFEHPLRGFVRPEYVASTGAFGPIRIPSDRARESAPRKGMLLEEAFAAESEELSLYGWPHHGAIGRRVPAAHPGLGERWSPCLNFMQTGELSFFRVFEAIASHSRDIVPFHGKGVEADELDRWGLVAPLPTSATEPAASAPEILPPPSRGEAPPPSSLGPVPAGPPAFGYGWPPDDGPGLQDLLYHYYVTGDRLDLEALEAAGRALLDLPLVRHPAEAPAAHWHPRFVGTTITSLALLHELTGRSVFLEKGTELALESLLRQAPRTGWYGEYRHKAHLGSGSEWFTENWGSAWLLRAWLAIYRKTGEERLLDGMEGLVDYLCLGEGFAEEAEGGQGAFRFESYTRRPQPPLYASNSLELYILGSLAEAVALFDRPACRARVEQALDRVLKELAEDAELDSRLQSVAAIRSTGVSERVTDLQAGLDREGHVVLSWTTPGAGEEGRGRLQRYQVKMAPEPIVESHWQTKGEGVPFWFANNLEGEPQPKPAGREERWTLPEKLAPGRYYFCLRALDRRGAAGRLSNVAAVSIDSSVGYLGEGLDRQPGR